MQDLAAWQAPDSEPQPASRGSVAYLKCCITTRWSEGPLDLVLHLETNKYPLLPRSWALRRSERSCNRCLRAVATLVDLLRVSAEFSRLAALPCLPRTSLGKRCLDCYRLCSAYTLLLSSSTVIPVQNIQNSSPMEFSYCQQPI